MSCDWNIHCLDCNSTCTFNDANHQDELMLHLCRYADEIAAVAGLLNGSCDVELRTLWGRIDADWFLEHLGHNLQPIDEYGHLLNQCQERIVCECEFSRDCILDTGHEGPHKPGRRRNR